MQAMPDARQQSFEEIYGPPENFLEIEVRASSPSRLSKPRGALFNLADPATGQESPNPRYITEHVHRL